MPDIARKHLFALLLFLVALTILTYIRRPPTGDDAWFAEQSYWLLKDGKIRSEFFRGLIGWENQILVSHKLFVHCGALLISVFGFYLPVPQFAGFIFFLIFLVELILYIKKREGSLSTWYLPAILILVFSNRVLVKMSFENRPEMMLAALGFGSFLLIQDDRKIWKSLVAGLLAGAAMLCHLNGVIFLLAGFLTLIFRKDYMQMIAFSISGGIIASLYWVDVLHANSGFSIWKYQFTNDPATQQALGSASKLLQLVTYPHLFFHSPEQIALSLLTVFLFWSQRKLLRRLPVFLRIYALILFSCFWLITKANTGTYQLLFIPFMLALVYELIRLKPFNNAGLKLVLAIYLVIGIVGMVQIIRRNFTMEYLPVSYQKLRSVIGNSKVGLVPLTFLFNEYERYPRLLTHENYKLQCGKRGMTTDKMARWAHRSGADFILMDYKFITESYYPKAGTKRIPFYKLSFFDGRFSVYKKYLYPLLAPKKQEHHRRRKDH